MDALLGFLHHCEKFTSSSVLRMTFVQPMFALGCKVHPVLFPGMLQVTLGTCPIDAHEFDVISDVTYDTRFSRNRRRLLVRCCVASWILHSLSSVCYSQVTRKSNHAVTSSTKVSPNSWLIGTTHNSSKLHFMTYSSY
jgi:hypothetical protein